MNKCGVVSPMVSVYIAEVLNDIVFLATLLLFPNCYTEKNIIVLHLSQFIEYLIFKYV